MYSRIMKTTNRIIKKNRVKIFGGRHYTRSANNFGFICNQNHYNLLVYTIKVQIH